MQTFHFSYTVASDQQIHEAFITANSHAEAIAELIARYNPIQYW